MLTYVKDEFDCNSDDIFNSINKMLEKNQNRKSEDVKENGKKEDNIKK